MGTVPLVSHLGGAVLTAIARNWPPITTANRTRIARLVLATGDGRCVRISLPIPDIY